MMTRFQGRPLRAAAGVTVMGGLLLLWTSMREPADQAPAVEMNPVRPAALPERPSPEMAATVSPSNPTPEPVQTDALGKMLGEVVTSEDYQGSLELLKKSIHKEDERLALFSYYHERVLPDSVSRERFHELLSDSGMLAHVQRGLLFPGEKQETLRGNIKRLMQIDYLRDALSWKENPRREQILSAVKDMILEDNFLPEYGEDMRVSLAANKMELYELLYAQDPKRAEALVTEARGSRLEALMAHLAERNQRLVALEGALGLSAARK